MTVWEALSKRRQDSQALFVGEESGMERELAQRAGLPFRSVRSGAMHGVSLLRAAHSLMRVAQGTAQALHTISDFRPHVILLTGGFVGVPVSLAGWLRRVPSVVYLPDVEPGMALRLMARLATRVAATVDASTFHLRHCNVVTTGYPLRASFKSATRAAGRARFGLSEASLMVLVYGGSKGARSINQAVLRDLPNLTRHATVVHITGAADWEEVRARREALPEAVRARYQVFPFLHDEMPLAMAAADLVVCRAGASVLGELTFFGLPAVLIPYPHAWRYQRVNARYLASRGAAVLLEDHALSAAGALARVVNELLGSPARLDAMREASAQLAVHDGAERIAALLEEVARA
ncbi:MAG: UDP-N-acetylglucosamine--N-acetylmuramyl-(pentapeptide) pyrophosphoryl-undecaprenol N-acetylglucosamine transferase [Anaerolineae bacterium]|nr:UDP-N-acetylglucosamine--N-acetylmuramyl-(pentapeptide) pyrophosphoryl-undecaprenol N-acetylglucosamine transferase [Anaerolineae bacterium]